MRGGVRGCVAAASSTVSTWLRYSGLAFLLGIPLLATLPFGNEFQNRTFSLLLSQPVSRMEIWREKLSVTVIAVLSAVLVFSLASGSALIYPSRP